MKKPSVAIVRGKFLNRYEMQFFEPLTKHFRLTAFGSLIPYHDRFAFPVVKLPSPMDVPDFPYKMPIFNRMFIDAHYLAGLEGRLKGFDLVHTAETYYRYTQQCLNAKKRGYVGKVIATVLENIPFNNEGIWGRVGYKKRAHQELDHIIALTQLTKKALLTEGVNERKITVISHFVDTKRFAPARDWLQSLSDPERRSFTIVFAGRFEEYKGILDVFDAIECLGHDDTLYPYHIHLLCVGQGSLARIVREKGRAIGKNWHSTLESATYDQMPEIYRKADIFVAPSKSTDAWQEQYCTALLEAQASGLPIITTRSGGIPENVGDAAMLIRPGDIAALASAIKDFLLHPKKRKLYAAKARSRAIAVHDIRVGADKLTRLYERVLST